MSIVALSTFGLVGGAGVANYSGFCLYGPQLGERQKVYRVVEHFLEGQSFVEETSFGADTKADFVVRTADTGLILYRSVEEFLTENPGCCIVEYVGREGFVPEFSTRIFGGFAGFVRLNYTARLRGDNGEVRRVQRATGFMISNCGRVSNGT